MNKTDVLIVGAGQAGAYAAIALRQQGYSGSITMIGDEASLPYERPPLSKEYFDGQKTAERLLIRPESFWNERSVTLLTKQTVTSIDPVAHTVETDKGLILGYGQCIWAAGGKPKRLQCPGANLEGIYGFRTKEDADAILKSMETSKNIVVIGGGYIGLESASAFIKKGKKVTLLEAGERVLARVAGKLVSEYFESVHKKNGVDLRTGVSLDRFVGQAHVESVRLTSGEEIPCDIVIVGIGIAPCVSPLLEAGAKGGNGVEVDAQCQTSLEDIYAIGDCALHYNRFSNGTATRLESVQNANDQAVVAAKNIAGKSVVYEALPWFWSNQYDVRLQTIGLSNGYDEEIVKGDQSQGSFSVFYLKDGLVLAIDCINSPKDFVQGRKLIHQAMV